MGARIQCPAKSSRPPRLPQAMFNEAYGGGWTTKLDWFFHGVKHGV